MTKICGFENHCTCKLFFTLYLPKLHRILIPEYNTFFWPLCCLFFCDYPIVIFKLSLCSKISDIGFVLSGKIVYFIIQIIKKATQIIYLQFQFVLSYQARIQDFSKGTFWVKKTVQAMLWTVFAIFLQDFIYIFQKKSGGSTLSTALFDQLFRILLEGQSVMIV